DILHALQACRRIAVGFVALYLLLFEFQAIREVLLAEPRRDARLDQGIRKLLERVDLDHRDAPGLQPLVLGDLLYQFFQLAFRRFALGLEESRMDVFRRSARVEILNRLLELLGGGLRNAILSFVADHGTLPRSISIIPLATPFLSC